MPPVRPIPRQYSHGHLYLLHRPWGQEVLLVLGSLCHPGADEMTPSAPPTAPPSPPLQLGTSTGIPSGRCPAVQSHSPAYSHAQGVPAQDQGAWPRQGYLLSSNTRHTGSLGEKQRGRCWALPTAPCPRAGAGRCRPTGQQHLPACRVVLDRPVERWVSLPAPSPAAPYHPTGNTLCPHLLALGASRSWSSLW